MPCPGKALSSRRQLGKDWAWEGCNWVVMIVALFYNMSWRFP